MKTRYKVKMRNKTTGSVQTIYIGLTKETVKASMDLLMDFGDVNEPTEIVIERYFDASPALTPSGAEKAAARKAAAEKAAQPVS